MNNQVKLKNLKVHRTNSQTILYHVRFSADTASQQQHFLSSFLWFLFVFQYFCLCVYFFKQKIYILVHIRLCGRVSGKKKFFTRPISANKTAFLAQFKLCSFLFFHTLPPPTSKL